MNNTFKDYATSTAFHISFSQAQLRMIWRVKHGLDWYTGTTGHCGIGGALKRKGVFYWKKLDRKKNPMYKASAWDGDNPPGSYALTKEGEALACFLDAVGMFEQFKEGRVAA